MRKIRLFEILNHFSTERLQNIDKYEKEPTHLLSISKQDQDNAKFIMKYLDTADSKSFKANFCSYTETMFA